MHLLRLKELELSATVSPRAPQPSPGQSSGFDVNRYIHLVPVFHEKKKEKEQIFNSI